MDETVILGAIPLRNKSPWITELVSVCLSVHTTAEQISLDHRIGECLFIEPVFFLFVFVSPQKVKKLLIVLERCKISRIMMYSLISEPWRSYISERIPRKQENILSIRMGRTWDNEQKVQHSRPHRGSIRSSSSGNGKLYEGAGGSW